MDNKISSGEQQSQADKKMPYEKPSFRFEQVFVTTALRCTKQPHVSIGCSLNPKVS